jgi:hypothetical protein
VGLYPLEMEEGAYRDPDEGLRATLAELTQRASEVGARVDRAYLERFDQGRLERLNEKWRAAGAAATEALHEDSGTMEGLIRACEAHRALIAELEDTVAAGVDKARVAAGLKEEKEREAKRFRRDLALFMIVTVGLFGYAHACTSRPPEGGTRR